VAGFFLIRSMDKDAEPKNRRFNRIFGWIYLIFPVAVFGWTFVRMN